MILDDGGDATVLVLRGVRYEKAGVVPPAGRTLTPAGGVFLNLLRGPASKPTGQEWTKIAESVKGVTEETTTGVLRLYQFAAAGDPGLPGDQQRLR